MKRVYPIVVTKSDSFYIIEVSYIPEPSSMDKFEGIVMLVETDIDLERTVRRIRL